MPESVLQFVDADYICPLNQISRLLVELTQKAMKTKPDTDPQHLRLLKMEVDIVALCNGFDKGIVQMAELSNISCPECGGVVSTLTEGKIVRYRCHTGHAYSSNLLLEEVKETAEHKLWAALRSLEEPVMIVEKNAAVSAQYGGDQTGINYPDRIRELKSRADELHGFINHYLGSDNLAVHQIDK
jgi:two-component system chemotaxis response regulator CheB